MPDVKAALSVAATPGGPSSSSGLACLLAMTEHMFHHPVYSIISPTLSIDYYVHLTSILVIVVCRPVPNPKQRSGLDALQARSHQREVSLSSEAASSDGIPACS
jgi:hypothetical protein